MSQIRKPDYRITYEGTDITADVREHLISMNYADIVESESDDLTLTFEDVASLWKSDWYPETGAKVVVEFGYTDQLVSAGSFDIDELEAEGPPDRFVLKALATGIGESVRTKRSRRHEGKTLGEIAESVASENGLTLQGDIEAIQVRGITQNRETDLAFLADLAAEYGYVFSIRDETMIFENQIALEAADPVDQIDKTEISYYRLTDKTTDVYQESELKFTNPELKEVIRGLQREGFDIGRPDSLEIRGNADSVGEAEKKAEVALYRENSMKVSGIVTLQGRPGLVAGVNVSLTGLGVLSGVYHVRKSTHSISRGEGYKTTLDVKKVDEVDESLYTPQEIEIPVR